MTRQQVQRQGYLEEFVEFWSANADTRQIWVSLYTPQIGEIGAGDPDAGRSRAGRRGPAPAADDVSEAEDAQGHDRGLPQAAGLARGVRLRADHDHACPPTSSAGSRPASSAATPTARSAAASPRAGLEAVARHRLPGGSRSGRSTGRRCGSGKWVGRGPRRRGRAAADRPDPGRTEGLSRPRPTAEVGPGRETGLLYSTGRARTRSAHQSRPASRPRHPQSAGGAEVRVRADRHRAPAAGAHHPDPPLQHRLRLLQRVRQGQPAGADRDRCSSGSTTWRRWRRSVVAFSGGEPLLHPDLDLLIRHIRARGMMAGLITNGYLLSPKRILALNDAGLDFLQISIDNIEPDEVSKKSLRLLDKKLAVAARLRHLRHQHQLGARRRHQEPRGRAHDQPARAASSGFSTSIGIIHDGQGGLKPLGAGRARGLRRRHARDQRHLADRQEPLLGDPRLPGEPGRRQAEHLAVPRRARATSTSARTAWSTTARSSAASPPCRSAPTRRPTSRASS